MDRPKEIYKTIREAGTDEFTEKRSRFIGSALPVTTEKEALDFIAAMKSKYWDANHNVYAYILREGGVQRFSDDGEPQGTAGIPVLEVLKKGGLTDLVVVSPDTSAEFFWERGDWCGLTPTARKSLWRRRE